MKSLDFFFLSFELNFHDFFSKPLNLDTNPWCPKNDLYNHWLVRWNWLQISEIPKDFHTQNSGALSRFWLSGIPFGIFHAKFDKSYDYLRFPQINITAILLYILTLGGHLVPQFYSVCNVWTSKALGRQLKRVNVIEIVAWGTFSSKGWQCAVDQGQNLPGWRKDKKQFHEKAV